MTNAFQRLIADRKAEKGWSYQDIAGRAGMSRSTVYKLATAEYEGTPRRRTIAQLAKGLGLPESVLRAAATQSARTEATRETTERGREILIGHAGELSEEQINHVNRYIDLMFGDDT